MSLTLEKDYIKASQLRALLMNYSVCSKALLAVITQLNATHIRRKIVIAIQDFNLRNAQ